MATNSFKILRRPYFPQPFLDKLRLQAAPLGDRSIRSVLDGLKNRNPYAREQDPEKIFRRSIRARTADQQLHRLSLSVTLLRKLKISVTFSDQRQPLGKYFDFLRQKRNQP